MEPNQFDPKKAERTKAFELYMSAAATGKRRSLRSIAQELGVALKTIQRWRDADDWDPKINKILTEAAGAAETHANAIRRRVRQGLLDGLDQLNKIAKTANRDADRIHAVRALADIASKVEAIVSGASGADSSTALSDFKDDVEWPDESPTTPSTPPKDGEEPASSLAPSSQEVLPPVVDLA